MHSNSHPEPDQRDETSPPPETKPSSTRDQLLSARDADGLSNNKLSQQLGYSPSVLSQYLSGTYPGDVAKLERRVVDWLRSRERLMRGGVRLIETDATRTVASALEIIRRTNDVGLIHGKAGVGKTSGVSIYASENPTCLVITLSNWARSDRQIEGLIFALLETRAWPGNTPRGEFLVDRLRGSNRLLIVDNAHKATARGIEFLFDLHDETRVPIALVGNPEVLRHVENNDQRFSRIGLKQPVVLTKSSPLIRHLIAQTAPAMAGHVEALCEQVVERRGCARAVQKQLQLAAQIHEGAGQSLSAAQAFAAAHKRLVREYALA